MLKFYDFYSTLLELEKFKMATYSEKLVKLENAIQWAFPQPGSGIGNALLDYPNYILTHLRDWAMVNMIDDSILDNPPL